MTVLLDVLLVAMGLGAVILAGVVLIGKAFGQTW
jgi:hypothetical protein